MARPIRKLALSRRRFLRGSGACIALPWLDAMEPAVARARREPARIVFVFAPNGVDMRRWTPAATGGGLELSPTLEPLRPVRSEVLVLSRLAIDAGRPHGDGPGDHARAAASFLTAAHPRKRGPIHCGISVDQVAARAIGGDTKLPSLEIGMEAGRRAGACDSGYACAYSNSISWRSPTTPMAKEVDPRGLFSRLFGDPGELIEAGARARRRQRLRSVLDAALADVRELRRELGRMDRGRLEEYLEAVRALERRIEHAERTREERDVPQDLLERTSAPGGYVDRLDLMYDLLEIALVSGATRIATFMVGNAGSNRTYRFLGVPQGHHFLSHHRGDVEKISKIARIDRFHVEHLARFLQRLSARREADGSVLDHSMIVYGSGLGDGNRHDHMDLPVLLAGRGAGAITPGRHVTLPRHTPMANLYLTILRILRVRIDGFADSTGTLEL